jgi:hypothetical protein
MLTIATIHRYGQKTCCKMLCSMAGKGRNTNGARQMSKVIAGHVVSRNPVNGMWRAWPTSKDTGSVYADTYRGLLALIRANR